MNRFTVTNFSDTDTIQYKYLFFLPPHSTIICPTSEVPNRILDLQSATVQFHDYKGIMYLVNVLAVFRHFFYRIKWNTLCERHVCHFVCDVELAP